MEQIKLKAIEGVKIYGEAPQKTAVISFNVNEIHPYDIGSILDKLGIAVRTGHHCAQPIMDFYKIPGTVRASFSFYNTKEEIDMMIKALETCNSNVGINSITLANYEHTRDTRRDYRRVCDVRRLDAAIRIHDRFRENTSFDCSRIQNR